LAATVNPNRKQALYPAHILDSLPPLMRGALPLGCGLKPRSIPQAGAFPLAASVGGIAQQRGTIRAFTRLFSTPTRRLPVPNTLQIPLERNRDVQRRWQRMLQRTAAPRSIPTVGLTVGLKYSRTRVRFDVPLNGSSIKPKS
jgi:hypothetical protein